VLSGTFCVVRCLIKRADTERVVRRVRSFSTARARFRFLFLSLCVFILFSLPTTRGVHISDFLNSFPTRA
jgi:hypothetical protein